MKTIKINWVAVVLVIVIGILVFFLVRKRGLNAEIAKLKAENFTYTADIVKKNVILRHKDDTIKMYKEIVKADKRAIAKRNSEIVALKKKMSEVEVIQPLEAYEYLQSELEPKTDSLTYNFSGNQTTQLYDNHIDLLISKEIILTYDFIQGEYEHALATQDSALYVLGSSLELSKSQLGDCGNINSNKDKEIRILKRQKAKRSWMLGGVAAVAVVLAILK